MCDLAHQLQLPCRLSSSLPIVLPASFHPTHTDLVNSQLQQEIIQYQQGKYIAKAISYALDGGKWKLYREIVDKTSQQRSIVEGDVTFQRILNTINASLSKNTGSCSTCAVDSTCATNNIDLENSVISTEENPFLWYHEQGALILTNGMKLDVSQSYIYQYNPQYDSLDIYFSKVSTPQEIDRFFLRLQFQQVENEGWIAKAYHLCGEDHYHASYLVCFEGLNVKKLEITFDVLGPKKNYQSTSILTIASE